MDGKLQKNLGLLHVFYIAAGAMISSGIVVLPGLAHPKAGPAVIGSYFLCCECGLGMSVSILLWATCGSACKPSLFARVKV